MRSTQLALTTTLLTALTSIAACGGDEVTPPPPPPPPLAISTAALARGTVGADYSASLAAAGGSGVGYRWSVSTGALPAGLTLAADGTPSTTLAGVPTAAGTFTFTVVVTDSAAATASRTLTIEIGEAGLPLAVVTTSVAAGKVGTAYNAVITAQDGSGSGFRWSVTAGALPAGVTLAASGTPSTALSGEPTAAGTFAFTVQVEDSAGGQASRALTLMVAEPDPPALVILTSSAATGRVGRAYAHRVVASGGSGAGYTWSVVGGALPAGLALAPAGTPSTTISGTPTADGIARVEIQVTDSVGVTARAALTIDIDRAPPPLTIVTTQLAAGTEGSAYNANVLASGGASAGYTWSIAAGALPPGLALRADGTPQTTLTGTPTQPGRFAFTVRVVDALGLTDDAAFSVEVARRLVPIQIATTTVPPGARGVPYTAALTSVPGTGTGGTLNWVVSAGALPPGLTLALAGNPSTRISGTPTAGGTFTATITVFDTDNTTDSQRYTFDVSVPLTVVTSALPGAQSATPYSAALVAEGGSGAGYTWSVAAGALPPGLTLGASGTPQTTLSGSPSAAGTFVFTVRAEDDAGGVATRELTLTVVAGLTISTLILPDTSIGAAYTATIGAVGGTGMGYAWSVTGGALPPGLTLSPTGTPVATLSGTPTMDGTYEPVITVTDSGGSAARQSYTIVVRTLDRWAAWIGDARTDAVVEVFVTGIPGAAPTAPVVVNPSIPGGNASTAVAFTQMSPDGTRIAFRGDFQTDAINELFVVDLRGAAPGPAQRVNGPLVTGGAVVDFAWSPDSTRLVYSAEQDTDAVVELYLVDVSGPVPSASTRISGPMAGDISPADFSWSPDAGRVAYVADQNTVGLLELFVVDVSGVVPGAPARVNAALPAGADVDVRFLWTPDGTRLVYQADQITLDRLELYLADVSGPVPSPPVLISAPMIPGGNVGTVAQDVAVTADGNWVVYVADGTTDGIEEIYAVNIVGATPAPAVRISGPASSFTDNINLRVSPTDPRLIYTSDQETTSVYENYLVDLSGPTPSPALKIHPTFPTFGRVAAGIDAVAWSPDGTKVAYRADTAVDNAFEVEVVDLSGPVPGLPIDTMPPRFTGVTTDAFVWALDSSAIASRGEGAVDERDEAFVTRFEGPNANVPVSVTGTPVITGGQVLDIEWADGRYLLMRGDFGVDGVNEVYMIDTLAPQTAPVSLTPSIPAAGDVSTLIVRPRT